ncbi:unnamed protein product [Calypogeia fissa]
MGNSAHAIPEQRLICRVCQKQYSKYTPAVLSLACYENHSLRCTESFMRNNVIEEMLDIQASKESQQNMLEALKRIRFDDDGRSIIEDEVMGDEDGEDDDSDGRHGTVFSERTLKLIAPLRGMTKLTLLYCQAMYRTSISANIVWTLRVTKENCGKLQPCVLDTVVPLELDSYLISKCTTAQ